MERKLYIIRHGKSSWDDENLDDRDRPLARRGIRDAGTMAQRLADAGLIPELLYSSPAVRALTTAELMAEHWGIGEEHLQVQDELYMAYIGELYQVIEKAPSHITDLAIFGHNPSFTMFASVFLSSPLANLPTAGVVVVTFECGSWAGIGPKQVKAGWIDYPKNQAGPMIS